MRTPVLAPAFVDGALNVSQGGGPVAADRRDACVAIPEIGLGPRIVFDPAADAPFPFVQDHVACLDATEFAIRMYRGECRVGTEFPRSTRFAVSRGDRGGLPLAHGQGVVLEVVCGERGVQVVGLAVAGGLQHALQQIAAGVDQRSDCGAPATPQRLTDAPMHVSHHTIAAVQIWLLAALIGFIVAAQGADVRAPEGGFYAAEVLEMRGASAFRYIACQNLAVLCLLVAGVLSFGIITAVVLIFNGALLGIEVAVAVWTGVSLVNLLAVLLPHGIIGMGALLAAGEMGLRSSAGLLVSGRGILAALPQAARRFAFLGCLIVAAAAIEAWVTLPLAEVLVRA